MGRKTSKFFNMFIPRTELYLCTLLVFASVICWLNPIIGMAGFVAFIALVYYNFKSNAAKKRALEQYIESLTFNMNTATKGTLLNFPLPLAIMELNGTIIWYNSSFKAIFDEGREILDKNVTSIIPEIRPEDFVSNTEGASKECAIGERNYSVVSNVVEVGDAKVDENNFILVLYFVDNTELGALKRSYEKQRLAAGVIVIDNYDDMMQSTPEYKRPQMLAEIDKNIIKYTNFSSGIVKKYERDKYLYIFERQYLEQMQERKFELLDWVKEINEGNTIPVTLSLGFGINGANFIQTFQFANASIDIALGRGGDQAVVKDKDSISFFGGKTRELEKRTKVKSRVIALALKELVIQCSDVMIMGHQNCDIDCLGAALGLYRIASNIGKTTKVVLNEENPMIASLMSEIKREKEYSGLFMSGKEAAHNVTPQTLLIVVDTRNPDFTECPELLEHAEQVVVIDHHRRGAKDIDNTVLTYQEPYASSTSEIITELLQYVEESIKLSTIEAEALYAGIIVDTKNFMFKTGVRTFEAAAYLRRQGVDTVSVKQIFQDDLDCYIHVSKVVQNAEVLHGNIAVSEGLPEAKDAYLVAAKAADQLTSLTGIAASFVLLQTDGDVRISGRSLGDINVQVVLEKIGGGGHFTMAGALLKEVTMEEAKSKLKTAIDEYVADSKQGDIK